MPYHLNLVVLSVVCVCLLIINSSCAVLTFHFWVDMDTEIVDYTSETYSLGAFVQPHVSNSLIFSMDSRPSSSEHSIQEIGLNAYSQ